jgi:hypothetical protein
MYSRVILFALIIVMSGCSAGVKRYKAVIEEDILRNAKGVEAKPMVDSLVIVNKYTVQQVTDYWIAKERCGGNIDTLINCLQKIKMSSDNGQYKWFKWEQNRVGELKANKKDEILYEVVKAYYTTELPANKGKSSVLAYYILHNGQVVGTSTERDLQINAQIGNSPIFAYEYIQFKFENPELP